jgi:salicylate hydroxylase
MPEDPEPDAQRESGAPHALIAGAGIGGLMAALTLAEAGWRVTLADREPRLQEVGAGLQLAPNATRLLGPLGILDALDDLAVEPAALCIRNGETGDRLSRTPLGASAAARFGAPFLVVHRADLQRALLRRAEANPAITIRLGLALVDLRESGEAVTGLFEDGAGAALPIAADLLVAADGLWSRGRRIAGLPGPSRYSGKTAWRTLVPRAQAPIFAREAEVNLWLGAGVHVVHYPVCGGEFVNLVAIIEDEWREEGWSAPGNPDVITSRMRGLAPRLRDLAGAAEHWNRWALLDRPPESRWSRGRMTLLGDAAHPMLPFLAQGASQAIEDAAALAALLPATRDGTRIAAALRRYDALRIPRTARIQAEARRQGTIYHLSGLGGRARDTALRLLPGTLLLRRYAWVFAHDARAIGA